MTLRRTATQTVVARLMTHLSRCHIPSDPSAGTSAGANNKTRHLFVLHWEHCTVPGSHHPRRHILDLASRYRTPLFPPSPLVANFTDRDRSIHVQQLALWEFEPNRTLELHCHDCWWPNRTRDLSKVLCWPRFKIARFVLDLLLPLNLHQPILTLPQRPFKPSPTPRPPGPSIS